MAHALLASPATAPRTADDDATLITRLRGGDDAAFAALYRRYNRRIAAYIYGMVKDYGRAEDITQDVFVSALRRMRETDREIVFKPWVYEIAKNACIDQFRRSRRTEEVSYDADETLASSDHSRLVSAAPSPDAAVDQKLALDDLRGAFGGLSQVHHEILVMREFEGLSYAEIGQRLGMTRPSVESTLFRARRRLAEEYEELVSGARCTRVRSIVEAAATASLGARDRRKLAAHVSHCQPCRRHALHAGIDPALLRGRPKVRTKVAALLPLPLFLRRRLEEGDATAAVSVSQGSAHAAQWSAQLSSFADPSMFVAWARAAAAAATIAAAGIGAGVATELVQADKGASGKPAAAPASSFVVPAAEVQRRAGDASTSRQTPALERTTAKPATAMAPAKRSKPPVATPARASEPASSAPAAPQRSGGVERIFEGTAAAPVVGGDQPRPVRDAVRGLVRAAVAPVVAETREVVDQTTARVNSFIRGGG